MKKILIAATAVGATLAGIILYYQKRSSTTGQIEDAAKDAYRTMNNGLGKLERLPSSSMG